MSALRSTMLVAIRDATERARSRAFLVSTVVTVLLVGAVIAVSMLQGGGPASYEVALVGDNPPALASSIDAVATAADVLIATTTYPDTASAQAAVDDGAVDAAVIGDDTIIVRELGSSQIEPLLDAALRQARFLAKIEAAGLDPADLIDDSAIHVRSTAPPSQNEGEGVAWVAVVLLFLVITTYGQWVLLGVLEEKSTRVVEQLVSSTSVRSLLAGKVLGIGVLGFAQLLILILAGIGAGVVLGTFELPSSTYATAAWSVLWFLLGFAFYAVLYAAAGSLVTRTEDAQTAATPVALFGVAGYLATFILVIPNPESTLSRIVSLLPPVAPIAFPARIAAGAAPVWEIVLGVVITLLAVIGVVRIAARIYAGALLAAGSRVKIRQAWKAAGELAGRK